MYGNQRLKSADDLRAIRKAAAISMDILHQLVNMVEPGVTAAAIDELAIKLVEKNKVKSAFKGYAPRGLSPFPNVASVCINAEVVHAISSADKIIKKGDLVTVDFGIIHNGFYTDHCVTVGVGELTKDNQRLIETGKLAVVKSIEQARPGKHTGDIGATMYEIARLGGYEVVKEYIGHGIGRTLHESPDIPAYGYRGVGEKLRAGHVLCLEAQVCAGSDKITHLKDGWTTLTADGENCVWFEYMVAVTDKGPEVLTDTRNWPLIV